MLVVFVDNSVFPSWTPALMDWAKKRFSRCIASQIVEDGLGRGRRAEAVGKNTVMHPYRLWHTLIQRQLFSKVHRYREVCPCVCDVCVYV